MEVSSQKMCSSESKIDAAFIFTKNVKKVNLTDKIKLISCFHVKSNFFYLSKTVQR